MQQGGGERLQSQTDRTPWTWENHVKGMEPQRNKACPGGMERCGVDLTDVRS